MVTSHFQGLLNSLRNRLEGDHFILFYDNSYVSGFGNLRLGNRGILPAYYLSSLEKSWQLMEQLPFNRQAPLLNSDNRIIVFLSDYFPSPFTHEYSISTCEGADLVPFISLRLPLREPTLDGELTRAAAEAVHETTHAFNHRFRPYHVPQTKLWRWFDEGTAIYIEMVVLGGLTDHFRFLEDWICEPHISLDAFGADYRAGTFVRFLATKMGTAFLTKIWEQSEELESPLQAVERLSKSSASDLFTEYCWQSYFLYDHRSHIFFPELYARFGRRAVTESWVISRNSTVKTKDEQSLDHLACRYYRFDLAPDVTDLNVRVSMNLRNRAEENILRAKLVSVSRAGTYGIIKPLHVSETGDSGVLQATLHDLSPSDLDHIVLVIANVGTRARLHPRELRDDDQRYFIEASAI